MLVLRRTACPGVRARALDALSALPLHTPSRAPASSGLRTFSKAPLGQRRGGAAAALDTMQFLPEAVAETLSSSRVLWPLAGAWLLVAWAWLDARMRSRKPEVIAAPTPFNSAVLSRMPSLAAEYSCTPFLTNPHVETILAAKLRTSPYVSYRREIVHMRDGGVVALDWEHFDLEEHDLPADAPVLILLPGLTGGSGDSYVLHAVQKARAAGIRAVVFNSRSTANSPVITPQFYSASFTEDTREVVRHVAAKHPSSIIFAAGWSLGANILLCYLAEEGEGTPISAAVSMCNPFDLMKANLGLKQGFNQIYDKNLANGLKKLFAKHEMLWRGVGKPFRPDLVPSAGSIWEFDDYITIHSFGWHSVEEYYNGSSSCRRIPDVTIPVLCLQALDDPIAPKEAIPYDAVRANPNCILATTPCGGHLGWVSGPGAPFGNPWSDEVMVEYLSSVYKELRKRDGGASSSRRNRSSSSSSSSSGGSDSDGVEAEVVLTGSRAGRQRAASTSQWGQQQERADRMAAAQSAATHAALSSQRGAFGVEAQAVAAAGVAGAMARVGLLSVTLNALGSAAAMSAMVQRGESESAASVRRSRMEGDGPSAHDVAAAALLTDQLRWGL